MKHNNVGFIFPVDNFLKNGKIKHLELKLSSIMYRISPEVYDGKKWHQKQIITQNICFTPPCGLGPEPERQYFR